MFAAAAPVLFVLIWSTGFVAARLAVPHADPQLFLVVRMVATAALLGGAGIVTGEAWPRGRRLVTHLAIGALMPGFYLCASWWAVQNRMPAGIMSLLGALQPLPIALLSYLLLGERLSGRAVAGLAIGVAGVTLVLLPVLDAGSGAVSVLPAAMGVTAVVAMAIGTLVQHARLSGDALAASVAIQNAGGAIVGIVAYALVGTPRWDGSAMLWATMGWSVLSLSIAGLGLLAWLVREQGATRVSVLLLLVPALAAVEAWALFGERLVAVQLVGFALALGGVLLARVRASETVAEPA
jgi:drug/metabolite transporter (DMT)-like permease